MVNLRVQRALNIIKNTFRIGERLSSNIILNIVNEGIPPSSNNYYNVHQIGKYLSMLEQNNFLKKVEDVRFSHNEVYQVMKSTKEVDLDGNDHS